MANKSLFKSSPGALLPVASARNSQGSIAYAFEPRHGLAQYVATGCLNGTFYANAETQLDTVLGYCAQVDATFIAKAAVYGRSRGYMKDMPALLLAVLASRDLALCERIAPRILDNGKMLRNFVQILRSGVTGRKSLGTGPKRIVRQWLERQSDEALFRASVGNEPSLADIVKMVHPRPVNATRQALYGYLVGREHDAAALPALVREYEDWKRSPTAAIPKVPFQMLANQPLDAKQWAAIARTGGWQMVRMNLATFARHGAFAVADTADRVAATLRDPQAIRRARVFPYQLLAAYLNIAKPTADDQSAPAAVISALQDAMEIAVANVPRLDGQTVVAVDVSGSMSQSVTGVRKGSTSAVRCVDVASLVAAAVLRHNPQATILPFETTVRSVQINPRDSIMTNAKKLADLAGGGTNCSAPLALLNSRKAKVDHLILVSDNESWVDNRGSGATALMAEWTKLKARNPQAKLVCIDLVPNQTTQATDRQDILNVGGFSDTVFDLIHAFVGADFSPRHWTKVIEATDLDATASETNEPETNETNA